MKVCILILHQLMICISSICFTVENGASVTLFFCNELNCRARKRVGAQAGLTPDFIFSLDADWWQFCFQCELK